MARRFPGCFVISSLSALVAVSASASAQQILHVPDEYPTIQAGIDAAQTDDVVLVAEGEYSGSGNVDLNFGGKSITVRGENALAVITDFTQGGRILTFDSGETASAVFEGFAIHSYNGTGITIDHSSPTIRNCELNVTRDVPFSMTNSDSTLSDLIVTGELGDSSKITGGTPTLDRVSMTSADLVISRSTVTLTDCSVSDHYSEVANLAGGVTIIDSAVVLTRCTISGNTAAGEDGYYTFGGGLSATDSAVALIECTISENTAYSHFEVHGVGGGAYLFNCDSILIECAFEHNGCGTKGGGLYVEGGTASLSNCRFTRNSAGIAGGGAFGIGDYTDCLFERNQSYETGGGASSVQGTYRRCAFRANMTDSYTYDDYGGGGGLRSDPGPTVVLDSLFAGNTSNAYSSQNDAIGGGMHAGASDLIRGCTFVDNYAETDCGGVSFEGQGSTMANCVLWGNTDSDGLDQIKGTVAATWCDVQDGYPGAGNIADDPQFVDPTNGDYHLGNASPCIDAGNNGLVPPESDIDLDGQPRFAEDIGSPNMGEGTSPLVDMGCYEFQDRSTGLNLRVQASCPDGGAVRFGWANATPARPAALLFAHATGEVRVPENLPCAGTVLGLGSNGLRIAWRGMTGSQGERTINGMAPAFACGSFVQFIDLSTCSVSNTMLIQ